MNDNEQSSHVEYIRYGIYLLLLQRELITMCHNFLHISLLIFPKSHVGQLLFLRPLPKRTVSIRQHKNFGVGVISRGARNLSEPYYFRRCRPLRALLRQCACSVLLHNSDTSRVCIPILDMCFHMYLWTRFCVCPPNK